MSNDQENDLLSFGKFKPYVRLLIGLDRLVRIRPGVINSYFSMASDPPTPELHFQNILLLRSEERRVGKECRSRWATEQKKKTRTRRAGATRDSEECSVS